MNVLITGAAGFIGAAVCERLLARGQRVLGYAPTTPVEVAYPCFVEWFKAYHGLD